MLTPAQADHYKTEGYVVVPDFLSPDQVAAFNEVAIRHERRKRLARNQVIEIIQR